MSDALPARRDLIALHDTAREITRSAGAVSLKYFRIPGLVVETKSDQSPVTIADKETERALRDAVALRFPDHAILGEELGTEQDRPDAQWTWIFDPIDGTKSFIRGVPLYTTLTALLFRGEPVVGVIYAPATGEMVSAFTGGGAWNEHNRRVHTAKTTEIARSWCMVTDIRNLTERHPHMATELIRRSAGLRTWADAYGYLLVARGDADVSIDPIMNPWDIAPLGVIIREAGGTFSGLDGSDLPVPDSALASCTPELHKTVLDLW